MLSELAKPKSSVKRKEKLKMELESSVKDLRENPFISHRRNLEMTQADPRILRVFVDETTIDPPLSTRATSVASVVNDRQDRSDCKHCGK